MVVEKEEGKTKVREDKEGEGLEYFKWKELQGFIYNRIKEIQGKEE
jgi:hypothetical protein